MTRWLVRSLEDKGNLGFSVSCGGSSHIPFFSRFVHSAEQSFFVRCFSAFLSVFVFGTSPTLVVETKRGARARNLVRGFRSNRGEKNVSPVPTAPNPTTTKTISRDRYDDGFPQPSPTIPLCSNLCVRVPYQTFPFMVFLLFFSSSFLQVHHVCVL
jgi:hypothetical protein